MNKKTNFLEKILKYKAQALMKKKIKASTTHNKSKIQTKSILNSKTKKKKNYQ